MPHFSKKIGPHTRYHVGARTYELSNAPKCSYGYSYWW